MKAKLIEIIGFGMEPEHAELKADEVIELFKIKSCCPLCGDPASVKIRICERHQKYLDI